MAKANKNWSETNKTTATNNAASQAATARDVSTVVGLRRDFSIPPLSLWANRFIIAAIIQGALAAGVTAYLLLSGLGWLGGFEASRVVASGNAGMWLTVGFLVFIVLGPIAAAVTALFYQHLETNLGVHYMGWTRLLAWSHLVLMNVGVVGATWLMMNAGFRAGGAMQPTQFGGLGWNSGQAHTLILQGYPPYIAAFVAVAILGALAGGLGYVIIWRRSLRVPASSLKQP